MISPRQYEQRNSLRPQQAAPVAAAVSGVGEAAEGLLQVGNFMFDVRDEVNTGHAMAADVKYGQMLDDMLYNPETGYMFSQGADAIDRRKQVAEQIQAEKNKFLDGLSPGARAMAEQSMGARAGDLVNTVNRHAVAQSREYLNQQSEATIGLYAQQAILRPDEVSKSLAVINGQINERAAREGWSPERRQLELMTAQSGVHRGIAERLATASPMQAMDYVSANRDKFSGTDLADLEVKLAPAAKAERGRAAASSVLGGTGYVYSTRIEEGMGPKRPNRPAQPVIDTVGMAAEDVFGKGARVVITSGTEDEGNQHGSARHKTGNAADIAIYRPDGTRVKATDEDAKAFAMAAARRGAKGIGFGAEYMGGEHFHIDLVDHSSVGGAPVWASGAKGMSDQIAAAMGEFQGYAGGSIMDLYNIPDPEVREAALAEYSLFTGLQGKEYDAQVGAATNAAFQLIEQGQSVDNLSIEFRNMIGMEGMSKLRSYQEKVNSGETVRTDSATYIDLRRMAETDPNGFARVQLLDYVDRLSEGDLKKFADLQANGDRAARGESVNGPKLSTVRSDMKPFLDAAGIDDRKPDGMKKALMAEENYIRWFDAFIAQEKREPTAAERTEFMKQSILTTVRIDRDFRIGDMSGQAFEIQYDGRRVNSGDAVAVTNALPLSELSSGAADIYISGIKVPPVDVSDAISAFQQRYGQDPTSQELVQMLIASGAYQ